MVVTGQDEVFGPWICARLPDCPNWLPGMGATIGQINSVGEPVAATLFENCNGASIILHCVIERPITRQFAWFNSYYPFVQLGLNKIISPVEEDNWRSRRFIEHYGFTLETRIVGASRSGDLLLYTMTPQQCRWLKKEDYCGKTICT
jgi:hypothetical protein